MTAGESLRFEPHTNLTTGTRDGHKPFFFPSCKHTRTMYVYLVTPTCLLRLSIIVTLFNKRNSSAATFCGFHLALWTGIAFTFRHSTRTMHIVLSILFHLTTWKREKLGDIGTGNKEALQEITRNQGVRQSKDNASYCLGGSAQPNTSGRRTCPLSIINPSETTKPCRSSTGSASQAGIPLSGKSSNPVQTASDTFSLGSRISGTSNCARFLSNMARGSRLTCAPGSRRFVDSEEKLA